MSAVCTDREKLVTETCQDYIFALHLTKGHGTICKIADRESIFEIGLLCFYHFPSLTMPASAASMPK